MARPISPDAPATQSNCIIQFHLSGQGLLVLLFQRSPLSGYWLEKLSTNERVRSRADGREREPGPFGHIEQ